MSNVFMSGDMREPLVVIRPEDPFYTPVMESAESREMARIAEFAGQQTRALAMTTVLDWVYGMDYKHDPIASAVLESANEDYDDESEDDEELTADEEDYADELMESIGQAMVFLGAGPTAVTEFLNSGDDKIGESIGNVLMDKLDAEPTTDEMLISRFAVLEGAVLEGVVKKVQDGQVVFKKKRKKKFRMSSAQKAALKTNRKKSQTSAAKLSRKKSMKIRKQHGMD